MLRLHHSTSPRPDAVGLVGLDAGSETGTYRGHDGLESPLTSLEEP